LIPQGAEERDKKKINLVCRVVTAAILLGHESRTGREAEFHRSGEKRGQRSEQGVYFIIVLPYIQYIV
jgi:hypothetical protein